MKYSIIVCVYNGEKYIDSCMKNLLNQTYLNYEIILVNDGSTDQSLKKLKKYENNKKVKIVSIENKGLSEARNIGVQKSTGDYLLFLDIDDKVPTFYLETIEKNMEKDLDLIKFSYAYTYDHKDKENVITHYEGKVLSGPKAFEILAKNKSPFELAVLYAYNKKFYTKNHFSFSKGMYHEDYGLVPYILLKSKKVKLIDAVLYEYYQSDNSITRNNDYQKTVKKSEDIFTHSMVHKKRIEKEKVEEKIKNIFYSYMANAILLKYQELKGNEKEEYKKKIIQNHVLDDLLDDTFKRKIKKIIWKMKMR